MLIVLAFNVYLILIQFVNNFTLMKLKDHRAKEDFNQDCSGTQNKMQLFLFEIPSQYIFLWQQYSSGFPTQIQDPSFTLTLVKEETE